MAAATALLSLISSRTIIAGGTKSASLSATVWSLAIWPIERSVAPSIMMDAGRRAGDPQTHYVCEPAFENQPNRHSFRAGAKH